MTRLIVALAAFWVVWTGPSHAQTFEEARERAAIFGVINAKKDWYALSGSNRGPSD